MSYRSRQMIEQAYLNFNGGIDAGEDIVALATKGAKVSHALRWPTRFYRGIWCST